MLAMVSLAVRPCRLMPVYTDCGRWDRPNEEVSAALEARIQQANVQVDEAVQVGGACLSLFIQYISSL